MGTAPYTALEVHAHVIFQVNDLIVEIVCLVFFFQKPSERAGNLRHHLISFTTISWVPATASYCSRDASWPGAPGRTPVPKDESTM